MSSESGLVFYHSPNTRSAGTFTLLEELGVPYELQVLDMKAGEQRRPAYLAINPMGKVPAIRHDGALVTEQVAIYLYLADLFPEAGLAPAVTDPLRGPYLRWMSYYGSKALKRDPAPPSMCPYGDYDTMLATLVDQLRTGPYILGERFTAADVLWGTSLGWITGFKLVPALPEIMAYVDRVTSRPSFAKVKAHDAAWQPG
jgi:glutathione S-transferase